jgi:ssRNA-specific RNase YbeY (16S rRNA maturation enzyme)
MRLTYRFNEAVIQLIETPNEADAEFDIRILAENKWDGMKEIQKKFEENSVYTDVLFYPYENHRYQVIVRQDYYVDFVLELLKHQLLEKVEWN